ncbi:hypothetical protein JTB14_031251 [Gonioctena quinquepunctata]|nr:hypothetical protein JTB14_031251 [Gonioctena quinquepunctata]
MNRKIAEEVMKIKIGWIQCRVRKKVSLQIRLRCHLFGHRKEGCLKEGRSEVCLEYTRKGPIAKDCRNSPACIACKVHGDRLDQTKCPQYRKLIRDEVRLVSTTTTATSKRNSFMTNHPDSIENEIFKPPAFAYVLVSVRASQLPITIEFLQNNSGRGRAAHDLAYTTAIKRNADILVVGEPNEKVIENTQWIKVKKADVAILFLNKKLEVVEASI